MRKTLLVLAVLCSIIGLSLINNSEGDAQSVIDVDESNYRTPIVGGSPTNNIYEITRFSCVGHNPFGHQEGQVLIDINIIGAGNNDEGTPIYSSGNGTVRIADAGQGLVQIENQEMGNYYGHMAKLFVSAGQSVVKGQLIGYMGNEGVSQGSHLHWETYPMPGYSFDPTQIEGVEETLPGGACTSNPIDGYIWGASISGFNSCPDYYAQGLPEAALFDHANCKGNRLLIDTPNVGWRLYGSYDERVTGTP